MSKQVRLKFKKLLKKAEFVYADLEYHDELLPDAKLNFAQEVSNILNSLTPEEKTKIDEHRKKSLDEIYEQLKKESAERDDQENSANEEGASNVPAPSDMLYGEEFPEGYDLSPHLNEAGEIDVKTTELKKLFYKIADLTHPDKTAARGASKLETKRLEKLFRRATEAYNNLNWYVLHSIAMDLDIDVEDPTEDHLKWLEDDIRLTMGQISQIGILVVWVWYTGNQMTKNMAMANYLKQAFDYDWKPSLTD